MRNDEIILTEMRVEEGWNPKRMQKEVVLKNPLLEAAKGSKTPWFLSWGLDAEFFRSFCGRTPGSSMLKSGMLRRDPLEGRMEAEEKRSASKFV